MKTHCFCPTSLISVALLACCLAPGCGNSAGDASPITSGIQGQATRGPLTPVSQQGVPNTAPLPGVIIEVESTNGAVIARQVTDGQGNFKFAIAPGSYTLMGLPPAGGPPPVPPAQQAVTVPAGQYVTVNVPYDTEIR